VPSAKQLAFLIAPQLEVLYGGAAYGGKTVAIAMCALQHVDVPDASALILRRTFTEGEQPDAVNNVLHTWLANTDVHWDGLTHIYTWPSGYQLALGYLDNDIAMKRWDSSQFQLIEFDELTHWPEHQYTYMFRRLRPAHKGQQMPIRMRGGTNPGGIGHAWVKRRFINEHSDQRLFIPATMDDNPFGAVDTYKASLAQTDYITRARLIEGNWDVEDNLGLFKREWFRVVRQLPFDPALLRPVRYWDFAASEPKVGSDPDWTVGLKAYLFQGRVYVVDVMRMQARPKAVEEKVKWACAFDGPGCTVWIEQEPGASGINLIVNYQEKLPGYAVRGDRVTGPKRLRWIPASAMAEHGGVILLEAGWNEPFLNAIEMVGTGAELHDDDADALAGAIAKLTGGRVEAWLALYQSMKDGYTGNAQVAQAAAGLVVQVPLVICAQCKEPIANGEEWLQDAHLRVHRKCLRLWQAHLGTQVPQVFTKQAPSSGLHSGALWPYTH